jgi:hypothetical protein
MCRGNPRVQQAVPLPLPLKTPTPGQGYRFLRVRVKGMEGLRNMEGFGSLSQGYVTKVRYIYIFK